MGTPSQLTLCCLQPLLNPELDNEYYEALGLDRTSSVHRTSGIELARAGTCSTAVVKRSYRTMSLRLHPDKRTQRGEEVSEADVILFQRVKEAYETLSDPKKRRIYDALGELGLKLHENPTSVSPEAVMQKVSKVGTRCRCLILLAIAASVSFFFVYFPILTALNVDGVLTVPWAVVMLPIWLVDAFMLLNIVAWVFERESDEAAADRSSTGDFRDEEQGGGAPSASENDEREGFVDEDFEDEQQLLDEAPLWVRVSALVKLCLVIVFQSLAVAALDGGDLYPTFIIFAPLLAREIIAILELAPLAMCVKIDPPPPPSPQRSMATAENQSGESDEVEHEIRTMMYMQQVEERDNYRRMARFVALRLALEALIAIKLSLPGGGKSSNMSWWLVFVPVWLQAAIYCGQGLRFAYASRSIKQSISNDAPPRSSDEEDDPDKNLSDEDKAKAAAASHASASAYTSLCSCLCLAVVGILVVLRLVRQRHPYYTALVCFAPVLLVVCCCYCVTALFVCCFRSVSDFDDTASVTRASQQNDAPEDASPDIVYIPQSAPADAAASSEAAAPSTTVRISETEITLNVDSPLVPAADQRAKAPVPSDGMGAEPNELISDLD